MKEICRNKLKFTPFTKVKLTMWLALIYLTKTVTAQTPIDTSEVCKRYSQTFGVTSYADPNETF